MVTRLEGLQESASVARPLTAAAHQTIPLTQSASAVRVKSTAINVSAESVLELLGEIRPNQTGQAGDWLLLRQTATVDRCKLIKSVLHLAAMAPLPGAGRGATSAVDLRQAATF